MIVTPVQSEATASFEEPSIACQRYEDPRTGERWNRFPERQLSVLHEMCHSPGNHLGPLISRYKVIPFGKEMSIQFSLPMPNKSAETVLESETGRFSLSRILILQNHSEIEL